MILRNLLQSSWIWECAMVGYLLVAMLHHARKREFPYQCEKRWLAFPELMALTILDCGGSIPSGAIVALRYTQNALLALAGVPRTFVIGYCFGFGLSVAIPVWAKMQVFSGAAAIALFHIAMAAGLSFLICHRQKHPDAEREALSREMKARLWHGVTAHRKEVECSCHRRRAVFAQLYFYAQMLYLPSLPVLSEKPGWHLTVQNNLETCMRALSTLESVLAQRSSARQLAETVALAPFLEKHYQTSLVIGQARRGESEAQSPPLQIHFLGDVPPKVDLQPALWDWITYSWLSYLSGGPHSAGIQDPSGDVKVLISRDNEQNWHWKGVGKVSVEERYRIEGFRCPVCGKQVRNLYFCAISEAACRECLKNKVETKLREDWDPARESSSLWLVNQLLTGFDVGYVQYGIYDWDQWEYFVTLTAKNCGETGSTGR